MMNARLGIVNNLIAGNVFAYFPRRSAEGREILLWWLERRSMTAHKRVQDRSVKKRSLDLEAVTDKWKTVSKVIAIIDTLKGQPDMIMAVREMQKLRSAINLPRPYRLSDFLRKSPKVFELYKDQSGVLWCGLTGEAEALVEKEERLLKDHSVQVAEYVTRCLMMSVEKRLSLDKISHFRRDFGLPADFRKIWVNDYPELFRVVKDMNGIEYLELSSWNPSWAVTELEKKILGESGRVDLKPGWLSLPFPLKFPPNFKRISTFKEKLDDFQKRSYLSPYADGSGLAPGSLEFDKRAVAIMHELLNFTLEKRLVTDHLTHFRREFVMPQKLMRLLLKHFGIFYVSEKGKRFSVFLTEAYEGQELIHKCPLVTWKEKLHRIVGYRKRKNVFDTFTDTSDMEDIIVSDDDLMNEDVGLQMDVHEPVGATEVELLSDNDEMNIGNIQSIYS